MLYIREVIQMQNPNALIAMAHVSENANNPYSAFCEYIKYCITVNSADRMTMREIKDAVVREFGICIPYNVIKRCFAMLAKDGFIALNEHQIERLQDYDTENFEKRRTEFKRIENALLDDLIHYVKKYNREWTREYAREQLLNVLDKDKLAYEIFIGSPDKTDAKFEFSDDNEEESCIEGNEDKQPLYPDILFAGRFILELLKSDSASRDYLVKVCEGLMVCIGVYQLPANGVEATTPNIKGTEFFFDTKLLLRYLGCASQASVEATCELVNLIQEAGGIICYYPHTFEEMSIALEEAEQCIKRKRIIKDPEMRLFCTRNRVTPAVLSAMRTTLKETLMRKKIRLRMLEEHMPEKGRIQFGFELGDLESFMQDDLGWDIRTIQNDATSIWETHMRRKGNYEEYCGTNAKLCVFVTSNNKLIKTALGYRERRNDVSGIRGWRSNRLPVITDIKLTCRLWSPASNQDRISMLRLTANAFAAQQPTQQYFNRIRDLVAKLEEAVPEYSGISLSEYFEDQVTNALLEKTQGNDEALDFDIFASTIEEIADLRAEMEREKTEEVIREKEIITDELKEQTENIIEVAVERNNKSGFNGILLQLARCWGTVLTPIFALLTAPISVLIGNWNILWIIFIPFGLSVVEVATKSNFIRKRILQKILPRIENSFESKIKRNLTKTELPYQEEIVLRVKENTPILQKCKSIINEQ